MRLFQKLVLLGVCAAGLFAAPYKVTIDTSALSGDYQVYFDLSGATGNAASLSGF